MNAFDRCGVVVNIVHINTITVELHIHIEAYNANICHIMVSGFWFGVSGSA